MAEVSVAVVQAGSILFDRERTVQKAADLAADAARRNARLVLFPEAFLGGYPKGLDFGARVGSRSAEGRDDFRRYSDAAIAVPGAETAVVGEIAAKHRMRIVVGVIEKDGGTLYCTALFFSPDGVLEGKH